MQKDNQIQREAAEECKRKISDLERSTNSICESFLILIFLFEREEYKGRLKATYRAVKASEEEIKRRHKNAVKELNSSFNEKKTPYIKINPELVGGEGWGELQPYLTPHAAKARERLSAPFDFIYCRLLQHVLFLLHFLGNSV